MIDQNHTLNEGVGSDNNNDNEDNNEEGEENEGN